VTEAEALPLALAAKPFWKAWDPFSSVWEPFCPLEELAWSQNLGSILTSSYAVKGLISFTIHVQGNKAQAASVFTHCLCLQLSVCREMQMTSAI